MTAEQYRALSAPFRRNETLKKALIGYNYAATVLIAAAYFAALIALAVCKDARFWRVLCVPAASLLFVTVLRAAIDRPRPYEALDIEPLLDKRKKGRSFPSRHTFSAFAIAVTLFYLSPPAGIAVAAAGVPLSVARVITGVHFPSDVAFGALLGIALAAAGLYSPLPFPA